MMVPVKRAILIALGLLPLAACIPQTPPPGPPPPPPRPTFTVADIPYVDDAAVLEPWNQMAGWPLFVSAPAGKTADIDFVVMSPICPQGNCADRRAAWVYDPYPSRGTIFYDPQLSGLLTVPTWQHELGHVVIDTIADTGCDHSYRGVVSYCLFWTDRPGWFGPADRALLLESLGLI